MARSRWPILHLMKKLYFALERVWFKWPQKVRFLLVGGFNTVVGYGLFVALYFLFAQRYLSALFVQYFITISLSFITMRYYVFQSHGNIKKEYIKTFGVYVWMWALNMAGLFVLVDCFGSNALGAQIVCLIVCTILTYLLHKHFSFK